ncbi:MAG: YggS family pyridoxal phosphate-dependent enzyme [Cyclobacteriaceae bacterium]|nr:YggS family pyridoxal phosphate-dependent enzyme [Cyclobacteriaceae bacterium]MCB9238882.1 YggS family pyridoxal phosphate-dependent enzyme [Flammeovirgaceae bacterium]MCB0498158.1 YggS family pyridoxal phosphate-dependent enzyme [Cyclobacteriaceae bacterium]MCO5270601.1 YggS family pyridoxal phosphate-dependent enzyme [Cyclobacteriaceae bacterium]MCW5900958.1 YggS family pyridoxal phosphate-dependent enzyme [Cyclobacteriaceae bacterium]
MSIKNNINLLQRELDGKKCKLIAVSKTQPVEKIMEAYHAGHRAFGENKARELERKWNELPKDIEWHMIGHLQTNKVKYIAPFVSLIHSVDSQKLVEEINKQGNKANRVVPCLLQVHIASEDSKFGLKYDGLLGLLETVNNFPFVKVTGLMGMATLTDDESVIRNEFALLKQYFDDLKGKKFSKNIEMKDLSMGMSADYPIAVGLGSTLVRIGTAIFGERSK